MTKPTVSLDSITFSDGNTIDLGPDDKLILVGPNNCGKSLFLRELSASASSKNGDFNRNMVVKDLSIVKHGDTRALKKFLRSNATAKNGVYRFENWQVHEDDLPDWDSDDFLGAIAPGFIKKIMAEDRLSITRMRNSVSSDELKTAPQHLLFDDPELMARICALFQQAFGRDLFFDLSGGGNLPIHVGIRPEPAKDEDLTDKSYATKVRKHPLLHNQGDGMKSYAGVLFEAIAMPRDIMLIDDPEAFLHPTHVRRLGETLAQEVDGQLVIATHSSDILKGILAGSHGSVRIARMQRSGHRNHVTEAAVEDIKHLWSNPILRHSNAIEGLFHEQTIVCESDGHCRLLRAIAEYMQDEDGIQWHDTAYIPAGTQQGIHHIAGVLRQIGVPVVGVYDVDLIADEDLIEAAVEAFGGNWQRVEPVWKRVNAAVTNDVKSHSEEMLKARIVSVLNRTETDELPVKDVREILRRGNPWLEIKKYGAAVLKVREHAEDYATLLEQLIEIGIVILPRGEIESYCPSVHARGSKFVTTLLREVPLESPKLHHLRSFVEMLHNLHGPDE